ncbi:ADP-ribose diphosphatase, partial [Pseudomonas sp. SIMBA_059]
MSDTLNSVPKAVEIVKRANCFQGFYKLDKVHLRHELFAGGMGREISR